MNETETLGLILMLLFIAKHDHYTKEEMEQWGCFRNGVEAISLLINFGCWIGACYLLIIPVFMEVLK